MGAGATQKVFDAIAVTKDVDGFAAESVGLLSQNRPHLVACTPAASSRCLVREGIQIAGSAPWYWGGATSSASPWRSCCCTATPR
jgi:5,10-methylene-tetrahydrofolate dehydrogenase/methenyl tetrahydrofolate cyclohydrolase